MWHDLNHYYNCHQVSSSPDVMIVNKTFTSYRVTSCCHWWPVLITANPTISTIINDIWYIHAPDELINVWLLLLNKMITGAKCLVPPSPGMAWCNVTLARLQVVTAAQIWSHYSTISLHLLQSQLNYHKKTASWYECRCSQWSSSEAKTTPYLFGDNDIVLFRNDYKNCSGVMDSLLILTNCNQLAKYLYEMIKFV